MKNIIAHILNAKIMNIRNVKDIKLIKSINLISLIVCMSLSVFTPNIFAENNENHNENHILRLSLINETKDNLKFIGVRSAKPGNTFIITPEIIKSGEQGVVTAEKRVNNDIAAKLAFTNSSGGEAILVILDQEQVHFGQPIFTVNGDKYYSVLVSKTWNKNSGPRYLTYVQAIVRVMDKAS
jgi:hypothetical protein